MSTEATFLDCSIRRLEQSCARVEKCLDTIAPEHIWTRGSDNQNAVGNLVLHLSGNIRQWILHGIFGDPDHRNRDSEFEAREGYTREQLKAMLRTVVDDTKARIAAMPHATLAERTVIQNYDCTKFEAIYHVVEHLAGHSYQIIFITKMLTGEDLGFYAHLSKQRQARNAAVHATP